MRIVTYVGLVLRRIWARKLMLLGSFLGATLVTALLVVLPLYESSIQAVDLLYTFRQAPSRSVDLSAAQTMGEHDPQEVAAARSVIARAGDPLRPWYPVTRDRIVTREFLMVPLDVPDWLGRAEAWRAAGGHDSGEPPPHPTPPPEPIQTRIFTSPDIEAILDIVAGELVDDPSPQAHPEPLLRLVFGERLAARLRLDVGDRIVITPFASGEFEIVEVSGIARPADPTDVIWDQAFPGTGGPHFASAVAENLIFTTEATLDAWTAPLDEDGAFRGAFFADPAADPWLRSQRGFRVAASLYFFMALDRDAVALDNVETLAGHITGFTAEVARSGIRSLSALPAIVEEFGVRTVVFGAPILAMLALVVAGALYFLVYVAALAIEREGSEMALLRMRGASPWQTTGLHLIQSAFIAGSAMLLAPFVARFLVSATGLIPPMSTLTGGEALTVTLGRAVLPFALAGGILTFVSMGLAILPVARRSVLELRALSTRPARVSVWQRYHLDLFLVVLAAVILWELRQRGLVDVGRDELGLDPFSVAAPALFLFAGALLLLRVLPWILRAAGWLMTRLRGMATALPGWHLGRNPIPYGRLALLVWLTTGFGAFALTYSATLEASYEDRAAFESGADIRFVGDGAGYVIAPDDAVASPVYRGTAAPRLLQRSAELLAVDPATFPAVTAWRHDFGAPTAADAFGADALGPPVSWSVDLPPGSSAIRVDGVLVPGSWAVREEAGARTPVRLMVRLVDERYRFRTHAADVSFTDDAWRTVVVDLSGEAAIGGPFPGAESLTIQSLWVERDGGTVGVLGAGELLTAGWEVLTAEGPVGISDEIAALGGFDAMRVRQVPADRAADVYFSELPEGVEPDPGLVAASPLRRDGEATSWSFPSRNRAEPVPHVRGEPEPVRVVVDRDVAAAAGVGVGDDTVFGFAGVQAMGTIAGIVDLVPTTGDPRHQGVVVMRLDALLQWANQSPSWSLTGTPRRLVAPQELWVSTGEVDATVRALVTAYDAEPDEVLTAAGVAADFSGRPIQVGLVAILFLGTGAGVVLALAGVTGYVLVAVRRRYKEMGVLRALGLRRRAVAGTFALEQLVVLGLGALIGIGAGVGLMRLMIPFLQLGEGATEIVPSATMEIAAGRLGVYLAVVAALLVLSVLASTRSVSARRLSEVLREVER